MRLINIAENAKTIGGKADNIAENAKTIGGKAENVSD